MAFYRALNRLEEKYELLGFEITSYEEAEKFFELLCLLYGLGKVTQMDMMLAKKCMDNFEDEKSWRGIR